MLVQVDLTDPSDVKRGLDESKPSVVIHCAAERHPDRCTEGSIEEVLRINEEASRMLAAECLQRGAYLVYISTDYVFDGTSPPYKPTSEPNPLNLYGRSKLLGEKAVQEVSDKFAVLRVPVLHGHVEALSESSTTSVAAAVINPKEGQWLDNWSQRFPTYTKDVAFCLVEMAEAQPAGIYHFSGKEQVTKYSLAVLLGKLLELPVDHIECRSDAPTAGTPRPENAQLDMSDLEALGIGFIQTPLSLSLPLCVAPFLE